MKKLTNVLLIFLLLLTNNAFALTWYWGENPDVTYTDTALSGEYSVYLPFTIVSDGDKLVGAQCNYMTGPFVDGVAIPDVRINYNMGAYWDYYTGTTLVSTGLAISPAFGYSVLPDGIYTPDHDGNIIGLLLNYYLPDSSSDSTLYQTASLNSFEITIGDASQNTPVPEPATILLLGSGLAGLAFYRRKRK